MTFWKRKRNLYGKVSKLTLNSIMNPFQQSIESFKREVQEIHHRETTAQGELPKELGYGKSRARNWLQLGNRTRNQTELRAATG